MVLLGLFLDDHGAVHAGMDAAIVFVGSWLFKGEAERFPAIHVLVKEATGIAPCAGRHRVSIAVLIGPHHRSWSLHSQLSRFKCGVQHNHFNDGLAWRLNGGSLRGLFVAGGLRCLSVATTYQEDCQQELAELGSDPG